MKKILIIFICLFMISLFSFYNYQINIIKEFKGYLYNVDKNITIISDYGTLYEFNVDDIRISHEKTSLMIGNEVKLTYKGNLKSYNLLQDVKVQSFDVYDNNQYIYNDKIEDNRDSALSYLNEMTLSQKVGQLFFVLVDENTAIRDIIDYDIGGVLLFYKDFKDKTKQSVIDMISNYQSISEIPLFIGVDEEGGIVNRVSLNKELVKEPFKSPKDLFNEGGYDAIINDTYNKINILRELGININFAPVADVSQNESDYIHERTFTKDAKETSSYVKIVTSIMNENLFGSVLKHFPGYGNNFDTHSDIAIDNRSLDDIYNNDFMPFKEGISAGASMVLMSHNIVEAIDSKYPSSLSLKTHELLRDELGFKGIIITDDLSMKGIRNLYGDKEAILLAIKSKNDMLCTTSNYKELIDYVIEAIKNDEISIDVIDEAVLRILDTKISLGIMK